MVGNSLGPYKIVEQLGAGGMGEVYLGEDTRLGRKVAIKVLPVEFASDPERLARFEQEARAAAALNHPHIAVVHDVGCEAGAGGEEVHFIVQELLEGEPLRRVLDQGRLPIKRALGLAAEIAEALGAAHAAGIVHRDLKPENVFATEAGHAKVLDFGLAKLTELAPAVGGSASMSPTFLGTVAGQVLGTAGYMAPEQVNGEVVDARADIFAFGCLLYEMATGRRAFSGKNLPETLHKIANVDPAPITDLDPGLPPQLQWIVDKALAKDPAERYQSSGELLVDLRRLAADPRRGSSASGARVAAGGLEPGEPLPMTDGPTAVTGSPSRALWRAAPWLIAVAAIALAVWALADGARDDTLAHPLFLPLEQVGVDGYSRNLDISPDGTRIVVGSGAELLLYDLTDSVGPRPIEHTDNAEIVRFNPADARGEEIAFVADGKLQELRIGGPRPTVLASSIHESYGLSWNADGRILLNTGWSGDVLEIDAGANADSRGDPRKILDPDETPGEQSYIWPSTLPNGTLLYTVWTDRNSIAVRPPGTTESRIILAEAADARYVPTGHLLYVQDRQLFAVPFDPETYAMGDSRQILDGLANDLGSSWGAYAFSGSGTLVWLEAAGEFGTNLWRVEPDGDRELLVDDRAQYATPRISPDMTDVAVAVIEPPAQMNLFRIDIARRRVERLTNNNWWNSEPRFIDDKRVLYTSENENGHFGFRSLWIDASGRDDPLGPSRLLADSGSMHPDGSIAFGTESYDGGDGSIDIMLLDPASSDAAVTLLIGGPGGQNDAAFSPDGAFLAYTSDDSGQEEVFVVPYPRRDPNEPPRKISVDGGNSPRWTPDSHAIWFYHDHTIFRVALDAGGRPTGDPVGVFENIAEDNWDVSSDGRFAVTTGIPEPPKLRMMTNFFEWLEAQVPSGR